MSYLNLRTLATPHLVFGLCDRIQARIQNGQHAAGFLCFGQFLLRQSGRPLRIDTFMKRQMYELE